MPKSKLRKGHKERKQKRKARLIDRWNKKRNAYRKQIEDHQKQLEEEGSIIEALQKKNNNEEE